MDRKSKYFGCIILLLHSLYILEESTLYSLLTSFVNKQHYTLVELLKLNIVINKTQQNPTHITVYVQTKYINQSKM